MRLGILGGTFDPPHLGHLLIAQDAWTELRLDRVLFVPAAEPPHKRGRLLTPAPLRLEMTRAAVADDERFEAADHELRRSGPSYSVDTLRALRDELPGAVLFFLIGSDQLRELHTWREPDELARLARLAVVARRGDPGGAPPPGIEVTRVDVTRIDVSATQVRERCAAGRPIRYLVPAAVEAIIRREGLYGAGEPRTAPGGTGYLHG